jgi:hypothetical protein
LKRRRSAASPSQFQPETKQSGSAIALHPWPLSAMPLAPSSPIFSDLRGTRLNEPDWQVFAAVAAPLKRRPGIHEWRSARREDEEGLCREITLACGFQSRDLEGCHAAYDGRRCCPRIVKLGCVSTDCRPTNKRRVPGRPLSKFRRQLRGAPDPVQRPHRRDGYMQRWRLLIFATSFRHVFEARRREGMAAVTTLSRPASSSSPRMAEVRA